MNCFTWKHAGAEFRLTLRVKLLSSLFTSCCVELGVSLMGSDKVGVWTSNELCASYTDRIIRSDGDVFINFVRKIWRCCYR